LFELLLVLFSFLLLFCPSFLLRGELFLGFLFFDLFFFWLFLGLGLGSFFQIAPVFEPCFQNAGWSAVDLELFEEFAALLFRGFLSSTSRVGGRSGSFCLL